MSNPLVSVIIPVYNSEKFIEEAIFSIINQTYSNLEIIILDDASTDGSVDVIKKIKDKRILLIEHKKNSGQSYMMNEGIENANGEYISIMHADDIALPNKIEKQIHFLTLNNDVGVCGTAVQTFGVKNEMWVYPKKHIDCVNRLLNSPPFAHSTVVMRTKVLKQLSKVYNQDFVPAEDYELWVRFVNITKMANLPDVYLKYRIHNSQISATDDYRMPRIFLKIRENIIINLLRITDKQNIDKCYKLLFEYNSIDITETKKSIAYLWMHHLQKPIFGTTFLKGRLKHIIYLTVVKLDILQRVKFVFGNSVIFKICGPLTFLKILFSKQIAAEKN